MYKISLVHKYHTHISKHDYSQGVFFEGCVNANTKEEMVEIINDFINRGEFKMYEANEKYLSNQVKNEMINIEFLNPDIAKNYNNHKNEPCSHCFGTGFTFTDDYKYKYFYWLKVENV